MLVFSAVLPSELDQEEHRLVLSLSCVKTRGINVVGHTHKLVQLHSAPTPNSHTLYDFSLLECDGRPRGSDLTAPS